MPNTLKTFVNKFHIPAVFPEVEEEAEQSQSSLIAELKARLIQAFEGRSLKTQLAW